MPSPALLPTYILAGPEIGRRDLFVREIAEGLAAKEGQAAEYSRFYAQDMPPERLVGFLRNASLFSPRRLIEYRNAEVLSSKQDQESLIAYIRNPAEDAVLLLVTEAYGLARGLEEAVGPRGKKIFWELRDSEKPAWLADRLARDRLAADDDAIETVLELVENETSALDSACTVLAACFPAQHRLSSEDIESALPVPGGRTLSVSSTEWYRETWYSALGVLDAFCPTGRANHPRSWPPDLELQNPGAPAPRSGPGFGAGRRLQGRKKSAEDGTAQIQGGFESVQRRGLREDSQGRIGNRGSPARRLPRFLRPELSFSFLSVRP
jgi:hypothetical protein